MTKTEQVVRCIFGPTRMSPIPLIVAIDVTIELVFYHGIAPEDVLATKDIYPEVARRLSKTTGERKYYKSVARRVERLANFAWDNIRQNDLSEEYLGKRLRDIQAPRDILFYLAFYIYLDKPYYKAIQEMPTLLF